MSIGLALLGVGHAHAAGKLRAVKNCGGARLVGVCEPDPAARAKSQGTDPFADVPWIEGPDELLARADVTGVIVDGLVSQNIALADNTIAVVEFTGGLGVVESAMMEIGAFAHRRFEIYGTKGTAVLQPFDAATIQLTLESDHPPYRKGDQAAEVGSWPMFQKDIEELIACIRGEKEPDYSPEHDMAVQQALLTACGVGEAGALE